MASDINCVQDLLKIMDNPLDKEVAHKEIWLRGETSVKNVPQPGLFREPWFIQDNCTEEEQRRKRERHFIQDFKLRSANLVHEQTTDGNLYFLMRHYKAPTRLLDWTTDPLTALYFACQKETKVKEPAKNKCEIKRDDGENNKEEENKREEGLIWIMNPFNLSENQCTFTLELPTKTFTFNGIATVGNPIYQRYIKSLFEWREFPVIDYVFPVRPSYFDHRIKVQNSAFTFHANDKENGCLTPVRNSTLKSYTVDKALIRKDLAHLKIDDFTIYDDLESLSTAMKSEYSKSYVS